MIKKFKYFNNKNINKKNINKNNKALLFSSKSLSLLSSSKSILNFNLKNNNIFKNKKNNIFKNKFYENNFKKKTKKEIIIIKKTENLKYINNKNNFNKNNFNFKEKFDLNYNIKNFFLLNQNKNKIKEQKLFSSFLNFNKNNYNKNNLIINFNKNNYNKNNLIINFNKNNYNNLNIRFLCNNENENKNKFKIFSEENFVEKNQNLKESSSEVVDWEEQEISNEKKKLLYAKQQADLEFKMQRHFSGGLFNYLWNNNKTFYLGMILWALMMLLSAQSAQQTYSQSTKEQQRRDEIRKAVKPFVTEQLYNKNISLVEWGRMLVKKYSQMTTTLSTTDVANILKLNSDEEARQLIKNFNGPFDQDNEHIQLRELIAFVSIIHSGLDAANFVFEMFDDDNLGFIDPSTYTLILTMFIQCGIEHRPAYIKDLKSAYKSIQQEQEQIQEPTQISQEHQDPTDILENLQGPIIFPSNFFGLLPAEKMAIRFLQIYPKGVNSTSSFSSPSSSSSSSSLENDSLDSSNQIILDTNRFLNDLNYIFYKSKLSNYHQLDISQK